MANYSDDQLAKFREIFNVYANRGDGKIQSSQIGECIRVLGQNPTEFELKKFTDQLKPDERISFEVFLSIYQGISKNSSGDTTDDFLKCLRYMDKNNSGLISSAQLRYALKALGEKLTDAEVELLLANQVDSQGNVNYNEFLRMVQNG